MIAMPDIEVQMAFEERVLRAWHEAHGAGAGTVSSSWGTDRVVVMIDDALLKGEWLLAQSAAGREMLEKYVNALLAYVVSEERAGLDALLPQRIMAASGSVNSEERWVMFVFRLADG